MGSNLRRIGPVEVTYRRPAPTWTSNPDGRGIRTCSIGGLVTWQQAKQLSELVNSYRRKITIDPHDGVLVYLYFDGDLVGEYRGWYLLTGFEHRVTYELSVQGKTGPTEFSLSAAYLGDHRQAVVERSAMAKPNSYAIAAKALVAAPWWSEEPAGEVFTLNPGGSRFSRPYDPTSPFDLLRAAPIDGARAMTIYAGSVTDTVDSMARVVIPNLASGIDFDGQSEPRWLTDRGGDVVAYDRSRECEVLDEAHSFVSTTDIAVGNGLVRYVVGSRGLPPYLTVEALYPDAWHHVGHLLLGGPGELRGARLIQAGPDVVRLAMTIRGAGDVVVTLRRGERQLRISWDTRPPAGAPDRAVSWSGTPPTSRRVSAASGPSRFGSGLDVTTDTDLFLRWPANTPKTAWSKVFWYRPHADASADAGLQTIYDDAGRRAVEVWLDGADHKVKLKTGATTIASSAQTYEAGDDLAIGVRFSVGEGMALSVMHGGVGATTYDALVTYDTTTTYVEGSNVVEHVASAANDPGTTGRYHQWAYLTNPSDWGEGSWGDGVWGGTSSFANGVIDNEMVFDRFLTDAEMAAVLLSSSPLEGLAILRAAGTAEGSLVWYAPFDTTPIPGFSALAAGVAYETTVDGGSVRAPDANGLTRGLAYLNPGGSGGIGAFLATTSDQDDIADHQAQFAAEFTQSVRIR